MSALRTSAAGLLAVALASPGRADIPNPKQHDQSVFSQLRAGNDRMSEGAAAERERKKAIVTKAAQWYAYRLAQPPFNGHPSDKPIPEGSPRNVDQLLLEANNVARLDSVGGKLDFKQVEFAEAFGAEFEKELKFVLTESNEPLVKINAVRMMAAVARMPYPALADTLVGIATDPSGANDILRTHAFAALRVLLDQSDPEEPARPLLKPEQLAKVANAVGDFVLRKPDGKTPRDPAVVQFIRRDAVRTLGRVRFAVIRDPKVAARNKALARPAGVLLTVATDGQDLERKPLLVPETTFSERAEAAIALCSLKVDDSMNLEAASYCVNKVLLETIRAMQAEAKRQSTSRPRGSCRWTSRCRCTRSRLTAAGWRRRSISGRSRPRRRTPTARRRSRR